MILMHKDAPVYRFRSNEIINGGLLPYVYGRDLNEINSDLIRWLNNRATPIQRRHADKIYEQLGLPRGGCGLDLMSITHGLSINDNYWVVRETDIGRVNWDKINLFKNRLSDNLAYLAFTGTPITITGNKLSPEYTGQGTYAKCICREKSGLVLYKVGTELELIVEKLVYQIAQVLNIRTARYYRTTKFGIDAIASPILTNQSVSWISAFDSTRFFEQYYHMNVYEFAAKYFPMQFYQMVVLDGLTLNPDRHLKNWSFELNGDTNRLIGLAPLYDYNRAFTGDRRDMSREIPGVNILEAARLVFQKSGIQYENMQKLMSLNDSIPEKYRDKFFNRMLYIIGRKLTQDSCY